MVQSIFKERSQSRWFPEKKTCLVCKHLQTDFFEPCFNDGNQLIHIVWVTVTFIQNYSYMKRRNFCSHFFTNFSFDLSETWHMTIAHWSVQVCASLCLFVFLFVWVFFGCCLFVVILFVGLYVFMCFFCLFCFCMSNIQGRLWVIFIESMFNIGWFSISLTWYDVLQITLLYQFEWHGHSLRSQSW